MWILGLKGLIDKAWTTFRTDLQCSCLVVWLVHRSAVQELNNKLRKWQRLFSITFTADGYRQIQVDIL